MITTTITDRFELFGDATFVGTADRFVDVLTEPVGGDRELVTRLMSSAITIPPSDLPAVDLPDYEPTTADLLAIESGTSEDQIDARIASANTLSAFEARRRDLLRQRAQLNLDLERVA